MNVTQSIQTNPAKALDLFVQLGDSSDGSVKTRERLLGELKTEIGFYGEVEETHLLATLRKNKETKDLAGELAADNRKIQKMLGEMEQVPKDSPEFLGRLKELQQTFQLHVRNERKELLPALKKTLSDEQMQSLANDLEAGRADAERQRQEEAEQRRAAAREEREQAQRQAEQEEQAAQRRKVAQEKREETQRQAEQDEREKQEKAEQRRIAAQEKREETQRQAEQDEREKQEKAEQRRIAAQEKREQARQQAEQDEREKQEKAEQRRVVAQEKREQTEHARLRDQREQAVAALRKSAEAAEAAARDEAESVEDGLRRMRQQFPRAKAASEAFGNLTQYGELWMDFASSTAESTARAGSALGSCRSPVQLVQTQLRYATEIGQAWLEAGNRMMEISARTMRR